MDSIGLATYSIKIREKGNTKNYFKLNKIKKEIPTLLTLENHKEQPYYDLYDIFNEIFNLGDRYVPKRTKKVIKLDKWQPETSRIICGIFGYGDYGNKREVVHTKDVDYSVDITEDEAIADPYYFILKLPYDSELGLLILQRKSVSGLKTILTEWINYLLSQNSKYKNFKIELSSLVNEEMLDKYFDEGNLHSRTYIKNSIPSDGFGDIKRTKGKMSVKIGYDQPIRSPKFLKKIFRSKKSKNNYLEFQKEQYDDLKVEIDLDGKKRIFSSGHPEDASPYIDITKEVSMKNGNPNFESIDKIARKYAQEFFKKIWDPTIKK